MKRYKIKVFLYSLAVFYWLGFLIWILVPYIIHHHYEVALVALMFCITLPYYFSFLELISILDRIWSKEACVKGEIVLHVFSGLAAVGAVVFDLMDGRNFYHYFSYSVYCTVFLVILWILKKVIFRRKSGFWSGIIRERQLWRCVALWMCMLLLSFVPAINRWLHIQEYVTNPSVAESGGKPVAVHFNSYEEYLAYISENNLVEQMVTYEDVKEIGEFCGFVFLSDAAHGDHSQYSYSLVDETGEEICVGIFSTAEPEKYASKPVKEDDIDKGDLRRLKSGETGKYTYEGIDYNYELGKLRSISWRDERFYYIISMASICLSDYPPGKDTVVSELLDVNQAKKALAAIMDKKDHFSGGS